MASTPTPARLDALGGSAPVWTVGALGSDVAVVCLHGVPGPGSEWKPLLSEIGSFACAIAPDLPGFGNATVPDGFTYTADDYASFVASLLDDLGVAGAHLVLHDFGGPWGLTWAAVIRSDSRARPSSIPARGSTTDGILRPVCIARRCSGSYPWRPRPTGLFPRSCDTGPADRYQS